MTNSALDLTLNQFDEHPDEISENQREIDRIIEANILNEKAEEEKYGVDEALFTSEEIISALFSNEEGDKFILINVLKDKACYDRAQKKWFEWDASCWQETAQENIYYKVECAVEVYNSECNEKEEEKLLVKNDLLSIHNKWLLEKNLITDNSESLSTTMKLIKANKKILSNDANSPLVKKMEEKNAILDDSCDYTQKLKERIFELRSLSRKRNVVSLSKALIPAGLGITGKTQWQIPPGLVPCQDIIVYLDNLEFRKNEPKDYINQYVPTRWDSTAIYPKWKKFMSEVFEDDEEMVLYMQRVFGYAISGTCEEHVFFILFGEHGRNGKSLMLETIKYVLGPLAQKINSELLIQNSYTKSSAGPSPDILSLRGKRIVWSSEVQKGTALDCSGMKEKTGGDTLAGRALYSNETIEFEPTHSLFMLTNEKPKVSADDKASWERIHTIDFNLSFVNNPKAEYERKKDVSLKKSLRKEASGILNWMIRGYQEYKKQGLNPPKKVIYSNDEYRKENDVLGHFIEAKCITGTDRKVGTKILFNAYVAWCTETAHKPMAETRFRKEIKKRFDHRKSNGKMIYDGISLNENSGR